ncbi:methionine--tRNA ligase [Mycoplasmopsis ciconiae]|uniref:Methionine--tRNA ligase n=1 Tax=Mycoplasmopsis ciconiae TaxID=561067 RepID=A0ABU7MKF7_9BACT|nr:methionine--tRNA ligase [Mycoplasmopsis ciconiae]
MSRKTCYITTPLYYASGNLHIGHLYTTTLAWVISNYKKLNNYEVILLTGSDEHGQKIQQKAKEANLTPQEFTDKVSQTFMQLWKAYGMDADFQTWRTSNKKHVQTVQKAFSYFVNKGLIYKSKYEGLYSISDEEFLTKSQANLGEDGNYYHPSSGHKLEFVSEESYFFKISAFKEWISEYIEQHPNFLAPEKTINEIKNSFLDNLLDLSVTRTNIEWGIPVKEDPTHTIYVWLDALLSYIIALGFDFDDSSETFQKFWNEGDEIIQLLGKEIARFHFIYWPIFLKSLDLRLPSKIQSHGWIITPTGKMSKSKGNTIDPYQLLENYHPEMIKYFFASQIPLGDDGVFEAERLKNTINADLINNYGNLVSRTLKMISNSFDRPLVYKKSLNDLDIEIENKILESKDQFISYFDKLDLANGFASAIKLSSSLNKYIDETKPWTLKENLDDLEQILVRLLNGIYAVSTYLSVVMPDKMKEVSQALNIDFSINYLENFAKFDNIKTAKTFMFFERIK